MNIKTRLEDDPIFCSTKKRKLSHRIEALNKIGIYTIEDFINNDNIGGNECLRNDYRAYRDVYNYMLNGTSLINAVILTKEYNKETLITKAHKIANDFNRLGLPFKTREIQEQLVFKIQSEERESLKGIEIISEMQKIFVYYNMPYNKLTQFYIDYYEKEIIKENSTETDKNYIERLKKELINLTKQRDELDLKISSLLEQISTLEKGSNINVRK